MQNKIDMKMHAKDFPGSPVVNTALPLQGEPIRSLVREIRSRMPRDEAKKKKRDKIADVYMVGHY